MDYLKLIDLAKKKFLGEAVELKDPYDNKALNKIVEKAKMFEDDFTYFSRLRREVQNRLYEIEKTRLTLDKYVYPNKIENLLFEINVLLGLEP